MRFGIGALFFFFTILQRRRKKNVKKRTEPVRKMLNSAAELVSHSIKPDDRKLLINTCVRRGREGKRGARVDRYSFFTTAKFERRPRVERRWRIISPVALAREEEVEVVKSRTN